MELPPEGSLAPSWSEAESSADARTLRAHDDNADPFEELEVGVESLGLPSAPTIDAEADEALEDAMLDDPMASVPVSGRTPPPAPTDTIDGWSIKQLKAALHRAGVDPSCFAEKRELVAAVSALPARAATSSTTAGAASLRPSSSGNVPAPPTLKGRRMVVKAEDIKKNGDRCFSDHDYAKAEEKYTKCIDLLSERSIAGEEDVRTLRGALLSNRSACRAHMNRHVEALADGRAALELRPGWARAFSRVGFALFALRRFKEAREVYEQGLKGNEGNSDLERGLAAVLKEMGMMVGASPAAAEAKAQGNSHFAAGENELALAAYTRAIELAPHDETLYSNRSAANAKLGR